MDNKILLSESHVLFEPHVYPDKEIPFIFHVNRAHVPWMCNVHENLELLYFLEGKASVRLGNEICSVSAGDLVIVDSYEVHQVRPEGEICYACLIPSCDFCRNNALDVDRLAFRSVIRDDLARDRYLRVMKEYDSEDAFKSAGIRNAVLDLLVDLCRRYSTPRGEIVLFSEPSFEYIRRSLEYIKTHFAEKLTVEQIAAAAGLSKYHFLRQFKKFTERTVIEYLNAVRCEYAKTLLTEGSCNVKEVALRCGFDNYSYFTSVFRKYTGNLPSQYLRKTVL